MLTFEVGQDLCEWREEMLFRFPIWQDLVMDSVKESKKLCAIPCTR